MKPTDVELVIAGEYEPENLTEAFEAGVLIDDMQAKVDQGKVQIFSYCLIRARNIYVKLKAQAEGWNDKDVSWYEVARLQFAEEAAAAIEAGKTRGYTDKQYRTFGNAIRTLCRALEANAPLDERDDASGAFKLGGKTAIEKWLSQREADLEKARNAAAREAAAKQGVKLEGVSGGKSGEGSEESVEAETSGGLVESIEDDELREEAARFIRMLIDEASTHGRDEAMESIELACTRLEKHCQKLMSALEDATKPESEAA